ncbi:hypothetical protein [Chitinimonas koreensis]|uniref:hypothetical protein n=1 Tax=Chitinimonas koreensis TaxID=356302 RepID=UPI0016544A1B|nr:hypothetical protein [Chitinimonas koreensis]QNM98429.1 hypothetical protein H9L41_09460 [Chitinimonas koreensis]
MKAAALAACGLALVLAACGTPPRERFYTLMPDDAPVPATQAAAPPLPAVPPSAGQPPRHAAPLCSPPLCSGWRSGR